MISWLRKLLRRKPKGPQPLTPGIYRLDCYVKGNSGEWYPTYETFTVTDDHTYASDLFARFTFARKVRYSPDTIVLVDDVLLRKDETQ